VEVAQVRERLLKATRRAAAATRGSPEWDAASAELEDAMAAATFVARLNRMLEPESERVVRTPKKKPLRR
jgi:hypothetical protein